MNSVDPPRFLKPGRSEAASKHGRPAGAGRGLAAGGLRQRHGGAATTVGSTDTVEPTVSTLNAARASGGFEALPRKPETGSVRSADGESCASAVTYTSLRKADIF